MKKNAMVKLLKPTATATWNCSFFLDNTKFLFFKIDNNNIDVKIEKKCAMDTSKKSKEASSKKNVAYYFITKVTILKTWFLNTIEHCFIVNGKWLNNDDARECMDSS